MDINKQVRLNLSFFFLDREKNTKRAKIFFPLQLLSEVPLRAKKKDDVLVKDWSKEAQISARCPSCRYVFFSSLSFR